MQCLHVVECVLFLLSGPGGIPPRGLLGDGPNDPRGGTLLSVTGEVIDPKYDIHPYHITVIIEQLVWI